MKPLLLIFCFSLLSISANSNIPTLMNNNHTGITQNNNISEKNSFKYFRKAIETNQGHKLKMKDRIKLRILYQMRRFSDHSQKNANRLVLLSLIFSLTGLLIIAAIFIIGLYSFIGLAFCTTGFILSIIAFKKEKKQPGFLSKGNKLKANIAYIAGILAISISILLILIILIFGFIAGGIAGVSMA